MRISGSRYPARTDTGAREFVITAEGNTEAFPIVDSIIGASPEHQQWEFVGLKPSMGFDFCTTYEGIKFDPRAMWFLPLQSESTPEFLGLRVGVPGYDPKNKRVTENAVLVVLDTALGERSAAEDVQHVEVASLPGNPENDGYIEMPDLPAYIAFVKRRNEAESQGLS